MKKLRKILGASNFQLPIGYHAKKKTSPPTKLTMLQAGKPPVRIEIPKGNSQPLGTKNRTCPTSKHLFSIYFNLFHLYSFDQIRRHPFLHKSFKRKTLYTSWNRFGVWTELPTKVPWEGTFPALEVSSSRSSNIKIRFWSPKDGPATS